MAKTKKRAVSKVKIKKPVAGKPVSKAKTKKAPARKTAAKRKTSAKSKGVTVNTLKAVISKMEKAPAQAIAGAKALLKNPNKQAQQLIANYKKQAKHVSAQWDAAQKKLSAAETKLAKRANATTKSAVKSAQKAYADAMKKAEQLNKEYDIAHSVSHQVKQLGSKFDYLAKEVLKAANAWAAPAAKPTKKAVINKPVAKKPAANKKVAKPVTAAAKAPPYKAAPMVAKPITPAAHTAPVQGHSPLHKPLPSRNPFTPTPITPQNIAQKPLTSGTTGTTTNNPKPDTSHKPFNFKDDF